MSAALIHSAECHKQMTEDVDARHVPHCICGADPAPMTPAQPAPDHEAVKLWAKAIIEGRGSETGPWANLARAYLSLRALSAPTASADERVQDAVGHFAIQIEKLLCEKLGRTWAPSGMSIETLVDDLAAGYRKRGQGVAEFAQKVALTLEAQIDEGSSDGWNEAMRRAAFEVRRLSGSSDE
jgi:hypothetical protein